MSKLEALAYLQNVKYHVISRHCGHSEPCQVYPAGPCLQSHSFHGFYAIQVDLDRL